MDPLQRTDEPMEEHRPPYFVGFHDAERRRKVINVDPTLGQAVGGAIISILPFALVAYLVMRGRARRAAAAASGGRTPQSPFLRDLHKMVEQVTNPMGSRDFRVTVKDTRFSNVIGIPEAVADVRRYVQLLQTPARFTRLGGRLPKGCLLTGKPGTGKTLLAKAVAGEAEVPFFSCSGADFIEVYAGSGPKRVRDLFASAKAVAPSVVFIDEVDAVGSRSSGRGALGLSSEENRTVNQLLAELDGLEANEAVVVFAATNFASSLDPALLREGRFDQKIELPLPDATARAELFAHYLANIVSDGAAGQPQRLAALTPGISPATIAAIVNEAALSAAVRDKAVVTAVDLLPAIDDVLLGKKHRNRMPEAATRRVALHESGHALVAWLLPEQSAVVKVSITPRGSAAGFTQQVGREALDMPTELSFFTDICVMLGGRLAEAVQHEELSTGAQDDYQRATRLAVQQYMAFGMSPQNVGLLAVEPERLDEGRMFQRHSQSAQVSAEEEATRLLAAAQAHVRAILSSRAKTLKELAALLYEKKELLHEDLERVIGQRDANATTMDDSTRAALQRFTQQSEEAALRRNTCREALAGDPTTAFA